MRACCLIVEGKKPKSEAYSGFKAAFSWGVPSALSALCTESSVNLPFTAAKSPQWLVNLQFTIMSFVGSSVISQPVIIPLNTSTLAPTTVWVSGSKNAL